VGDAELVLPPSFFLLTLAPTPERAGLAGADIRAEWCSGVAELARPTEGRWRALL